MAPGAAAKEARTRVSSGVAPGPLQPAGPLTDEGPADWNPTRISPRKLRELAARLERLRHADDAFAAISLSPEALERLQQLR